MKNTFARNSKVDKARNGDQRQNGAKEHGSITLPTKSYYSYPKLVIDNSNWSRWRNKIFLFNNTEAANFFQAQTGARIGINEIKTTHGHETLAHLRHFLEQKLVLENTNHPIIDIGASRRHLQAGHQHVYTNVVHHSLPDRERITKIQQSARQIRSELEFMDPQHPNISVYDDLWCHCKQDDASCDHVIKFVSKHQTKPILLSVDSFYYPGVQRIFERDLCSFLSKDSEGQNPGGYIIAHIFGQSCGNMTFGDKTEGTWTRSGKLIKMQVDGNNRTYMHDVIPCNDDLMKSDLATYQAVVDNVAHTLHFSVNHRIKFQNSHYVLIRVDAEILKEVQETMVISQKPKPDQETIPINDFRAAPYSKDAFMAGKVVRIEHDKVPHYYQLRADRIEHAQLVSNDWLTKDIPDSVYTQVCDLSDFNKLVAEFLAVDASKIDAHQLSVSIAKVMFNKTIHYKAVLPLFQAALNEAIEMQDSIAVLASLFLPKLKAAKSRTYAKVSCCSWFNIMMFNKFYYNYYEYIQTIMIMLTMIATMGLSVLAYNIVNTLFTGSVVQSASFQGAQIVYHPESIVALALIGYAALWLLRRQVIALLWVWKHLEKDRIINTSCISPDNYEEVSGELDRDTTWRLPYSPKLTFEQFMSLQCDNRKPGLRQIMPTYLGAPEPIIYHVCDATNYCALKRQATEVVYPEESWLQRFDKWFAKVFEEEIEPLLQNFDYSYNNWFNHLNAKQQNEIKQLNLTDIPLDNDYEMFVKSEKQLCENGKCPKNRCICSPNGYHKYVLGPVTYALERMFKYVKGYCGGKNWQELEAIYNYWEKCSLTTIAQLDGSGFDRTQHQRLKEIVDWRVYHAIKNKIHHVDRDTFIYYACPTKRRIKMIKVEGKKKRVIGYIEQVGKVFSGSCDTTLMNTLRMAMYNRFVAEVLLNLHPTQYDLMAKGDDVVVAYPKTLEVKRIKEAYEQVFSLKKTGTFGLGQIAKYIKIVQAGINSIDFCSTQTYWNGTSYKILRKYDRFLTLTPWSRKAVNYNHYQIAALRYGLWESNQKWMKGLSQYEIINDMLYEDPATILVKTKQGQVKNLLEAQNDVDWDTYHDIDFKYSNAMRYSNTQNDSNMYAIQYPDHAIGYAIIDNFTYQLVGA
jgi:hypothetical protein